MSSRQIDSETALSTLGPLLRSNKEPNPSDKILAEDILRDKRAELFALEDDISRLEFSLKTLRNKHAVLSSEMTQYSSILSPIRRLPPEIIGEIFLYFAPLMHPDSDLENATQVKLPWKLGHICRLWRTISLSLGQLWSVLDLGPPWRRIECRAPRLLDADDHDDNWPAEGPPPHGYEDEYTRGYETQTALDYLEACLPLFRNRPLSLRLWTHDFAAFPLLDALLNHSASLREMALVDPPMALLQRLSEFVGDLQVLRKIAFTFTRHYSPTTVFNYRGVSNLTELTLTHVVIPLESHLHIPWSRLTRYCEIDCFWRSKLVTTREFARVVHASDRFPETDTTVLLPNLRVASFDINYSTTDIIRFFEMPALEEFSIRHFSRFPLRTFLPRSSPRLKILRAQSHYLSRGPDDLECAFEMFPDLKEIAIDLPNVVSDMFFARLISYRGISIPVTTGRRTQDLPNGVHDQLPLAPKLEIIRLCNRTLADMLQARFRPTMPGISPLRTFEFFTDDRANDENVTMALKILRKQNHWDIRVGDECKFPAWDDLYILTA
ncbi:hypothetical protein B0H13DRAFT_2131563 [Mycena leptocephala]|nr:hypothetical protein B0H13DRAFT_2131563 [Mycena leptocephala]